jgi:putative iron-regulated protein
MNNRLLKFSLLTIAAFSLFACNGDDDDMQTISNNATKKQVIENYVNIAFANYTKAYDDAVILETSINTFVTTPNQVNFDNAKSKWKQARESYGTTEAFRFADGPIDNTTGPEGLINAWPLDENYVDYVSGVSSSGIINDIVAFPTIDKAVLEGLNEAGGEKNISVGYHAIEFLLWGQDVTAPSANLSGQRPYTDYVVGGTAANQLRRANYLKACADLLTDNLQYLVNEWKVGGAYRSTFLNLSEDVAIKNIYLGITTLVAAELAVERMDVALGNADQEDEHSCFSDNTHRDIFLNLQGVINVYKGSYGTIDGPSLEDLVNQVNLQSATDTTVSLNNAVAKVNAILTPFDLAISGGLNSTEGAKVRAAVLELKNFGANLINGASKIGITVN